MTGQRHSGIAVEALAQAVEKMHGARACLVSTVPVHEQHEGATVWKGLVSKFRLTGHQTSTHCYAWSASNDAGRAKYYAVLETKDVDSPEKAVRASIIADRRARE